MLLYKKAPLWTFFIEPCLLQTKCFRSEFLWFSSNLSTQVLKSLDPRPNFSILWWKLTIFLEWAFKLGKILYYSFHDGGLYHKETSPLIWPVNQWSGFYMIETSVMKEFKQHLTIFWLKLKRAEILKKKQVFLTNF